MKSLPPGYLENLRARIVLSRLVGRWVAWDKRKSNPARGDFWGSCPFHTETTASLHVDDPKGYYYCFGCHAKGDAVAFMREISNLSLEDAIAYVATDSGLSDPFKPVSTAMPDVLPTIIELKDFIVANFKEENIREVGILCDCHPHISNHPRLLRSLSWGDTDYPSCVLELLTLIESRGSLSKLREYMYRKFPDQVSALGPQGRIIMAVDAFGMDYEPPRRDCISVMMPFGGGFSPVYQAIRDACQRASNIPVRRADEMWENSVLIHDILELIHHSAFVICDLTGRNPNVFYELGIAHAWGKQVIPITQNSADIPFDLQHHRFLTYLNNAEGLDSLRDSLEARVRRLLAKK